MSRRGLGGLLATVGLVLLGLPATASAGGEVLRANKGYPGMTTFSCRTAAIPIHPGQNLNDFGSTRTCPNAVAISGPGDASIFDGGSPAKGYITRFKPSMVEIQPNGDLTTPSVWDLHLHHVVWLAPGGGPTFAAGEEKTIPKMPEGYGFKVKADANWIINQMIHNLNASDDREVYLTWEIDWVPETAPARTDISPINIRWMDVAGAPHIYPVFDAKPSYDRNGDGKFTFPGEVPTEPSEPGFEERENISKQRIWKVPPGGASLVFGAGHLHPGGLFVDLKVSRDGPDPGSVDGDHPSEIRNIFRSRANYYEPAGAVSWDVSLQATRPEWRVSVKEGDTVSISATYNVRRASWYESMGILPLAWTKEKDPAAKDPFDDEAAVKAMYDAGGIVTHGRLKENIEHTARKNLKLPDPRRLASKGKRIPGAGIGIDGFLYSPGGFTAARQFPKRLMRPPVVRPDSQVTFTNSEALPGEPQSDQVWHSITSCKAPCNRGAGIGYPLAGGRLNFDSGQLGYGVGTSQSVTTGSNQFTTPKLPLPKRKRGKKLGKTYTYFCRIHPAMRGSIRVKAGKKPKVSGALFG